MMKTSAQENNTPWDVLQSNEAALNAMVRRAGGASMRGVAVHNLPHNMLFLGRLSRRSLLCLFFEVPVSRAFRALQRPGSGLSPGPHPAANASGTYPPQPRPRSPTLSLRGSAAAPCSCTTLGSAPSGPSSAATPATSARRWRRAASRWVFGVCGCSGGRPAATRWVCTTGRVHLDTAQAQVGSCTKNPTGPATADAKSTDPAKPADRPPPTLDATAPTTAPTGRQDRCDGARRRPHPPD